jgi:hypothetical protein
MAKCYAYPDTKQMRDMNRSIKETEQFIGCDENGKPQYDTTIPLPIATFIGTVKVHGTNAGIGYDPESKTVWAQSRNHVLSEKSDNCGFHTFVMKNKDFFMKTLSSLTTNFPIVAYGEWFGAGIQKNVAVSTLQRRLMIFAIKIASVDEHNPIWLPREDIELFHSPESFIFNTFNFPIYYIEIDFNNPQAAQNLLVDITNQVEKECPVGKYFGVSGIGEGIVWSNPHYGYFKVKGKEHSSSNVTTLASVDTEKLASIDEFVKYAVTENRLNQGIEQVFTIKGLKPDIKQMKSFITWITGDITKEESHTLKDNGLIPEDVGKAVATRARQWFITTF